MSIYNNFHTEHGLVHTQLNVTEIIVHVARISACLKITGYINFVNVFFA